jgi:tetratricopeptide (TPR) repeat protein
MTNSDDSKRIDAACKKAHLYSGLNRFDAAEKSLRASLEEFGRNARLLNLLGTMCHRQSRFEEALDFFAEASQIAGHQGIEATINLAITLCDLGRYDDARNAFSLLAQQAGEKASTSPAAGALAAAHLELARIYSVQKLRAEAIAEVHKALILDSTLVDARLLLGKLFLDESELDNAIRELEIISTTNPQNAEARIWLGIAYARGGRIGAAKTQWQLASEQDPGLTPMTRSLFSLYNTESYPP